MEWKADVAEYLPRASLRMTFSSHRCYRAVVRRFHFVDLLRGFAAISVLICHYRWSYARYPRDWRDDPLPADWQLWPVDGYGGIALIHGEACEPRDCNRIEPNSTGAGRGKGKNYAGRNRPDILGGGKQSQGWVIQQ